MPRQPVRWTMPRLRLRDPTGTPDPRPPTPRSRRRAADAAARIRGQDRGTRPGRPETRVDDAVARLADLDARDLDEHADVYDTIHGDLSDVLDDAARPPHSSSRDAARWDACVRVRYAVEAPDDDAPTPVGRRAGPAGLARSRDHAAELIAAGRVTVGGDDRDQVRHGRDHRRCRGGADDPDTPDYVSRGGHKLAGALAAFGPAGLDVDGPTCAGRRSLDRWLHRRAAPSAGRREVVAVDVGYGQLAWSLQSDDRVTVLDRTNVRDLDRDVAAVRARPGRRRPVVHLADQGAAGARATSATPTPTSCSW